MQSDEEFFSTNDELLETQTTARDALKAAKADRTNLESQIEVLNDLLII
jgi:hypothetical protein